MNAIAIVVSYIMTFIDGRTISFTDRDDAIGMADYQREKGNEFTLTNVDGEILDDLRREKLVWQHHHDGLYTATRTDGQHYTLTTWTGSWAVYHTPEGTFKEGTYTQLGIGWKKDLKDLAQTHSNGLHNPTIFDPWASYPTI